MLLTGASLVAVGAPAPTALARGTRPPAAPGWQRTIEAWCDLLVPGAADHGVVDFVTRQLAKKHDDALLGIRYFDWPPPWIGFYQAGANALDAASRARFGVPFVKASPAQRTDLLEVLGRNEVLWEGPPFALFRLVTRGDAVDVVYGGPAGYARIGLPYRPQIEPVRPW